MKSFKGYALAALLATLAPVAAFADGEIGGVDFGTVQTQATSGLSDGAKIGLGVGVVGMVIILAWRYVRRLAK